MEREDRPITFTISKVEVGYRMYTKDLRVEERNRDVTFFGDMLFNMMTFASSMYNKEGYPVVFDVE